MKNLYLNFRKLIPIAIVAIVVSMLASCSSSNQFASSFSKRKYMAGHYSDPIAKVKVESKNAVTIAANDNKKAINNNITVKKEEAKIAEPSTVTPVKSTNFKADKKDKLASGAASQHIVAKSEVPTVNDKNNTVEETSTSIYASPTSAENTMHDSGGSHPYLLYFLVCILLMILFLILAAGSAAGGSGGGALLFVLLYSITGILALVFLILWIISLVS